MKKIFWMLALLLGALAFASCSSSDDDYVINYSELPAVSSSFLETHFIDLDETKIRHVKRDKKDDSYEVKYLNGMEIDFYSNGDWEKIDMEKNPLPQSIAVLIPTKIIEFINTHYPGIAIEEIERKGAERIEIELRNDKELLFDLEGNLVSGHTGGNNKPNVPLTELPDEAVAFLNKYYEGEKFTIEQKWDEYEVEFLNPKETEIEFTKAGKFRSIETENTEGVPTQIIVDLGAQSIVDYLKADVNFKNLRIEEFTKLPSYFVGEIQNGFKVELDGTIDYEVYFNSEGKYVDHVRD